MTKRTMSSLQPFFTDYNYTILKALIIKHPSFLLFSTRAVIVVVEWRVYFGKCVFDLKNNYTREIKISRGGGEQEISDLVLFNTEDDETNF
tara:strand:+ start:1950 stop:2222 length:273 start_codon:yes stop_codon:yes gene_type:complete